MGREGFEPSKALPTDLQSAPFDRSGISPKCEAKVADRPPSVKLIRRQEKAAVLRQGQDGRIAFCLKDQSFQITPKAAPLYDQ